MASGEGKHFRDGENEPGLLMPCGRKECVNPQYVGRGAVRSIVFEGDAADVVAERSPVEGCPNSGCGEELSMQHFTEPAILQWLRQTSLTSSHTVHTFLNEEDI